MRAVCSTHTLLRRSDSSLHAICACALQRVVFLHLSRSLKTWGCLSQHSWRHGAAVVYVKASVSMRLVSLRLWTSMS